MEKQLDPPAKVINSLDYLARTVLQPLRDELEWPIRVTSGYRSEALNSLIGGSANSQHVAGEAADIEIGDPAGFLDSEETAEVRALSRMLYRQATSRRFPEGSSPNFYLFVIIFCGILAIS